MTDQLPSLRQEIDRLDGELVRLMNQRAAVAQRIGRAKAERDEPVFVPHREQEVFRRLEELNRGPLPAGALRAIWREVMSASFALERPLRIAHFGQAGAFTHQAARLKFGESVAYLPLESLGAVFHEVEKGNADYGVVPIENSTDGSITDTIDAFLASRLRIVNELNLRVRHHLMSRCERSAVKRVYSRNTVFSQCRAWIAANLPGIELIEVVSTTKAADRAATEPDSAAIGPDVVAKALGLPVLASDIQDNPNNITRFVVVGRPDQVVQPTGDDKTSLMFGVQDRPGALYDCLLPFHQKALNLTKIESRPSRRRAWEYLFFIDVQGHQQQPQVKSAIEELRKHSTIVEVLGSYPRSDGPLND